MTQNLQHDVLTAAIPGYQDALDLAATLDQQVQATRVRNDCAAPAAKILGLIDAARDGRDVIDTAHELIESERRQQDAGAVQELIFTAAGEAKRQTEELVKARMLDVVAEVRDRVETIGDKLTGMQHPVPATADAAIQVDRVDDYKTAAELVRAWEALVTVYTTATRGALQPHEIRIIAAAAFCPNPLEAHPLFLERRANVATAAGFAVRTSQALQPIIDWAHSNTATGGFKPNISGGKAQPEGASAAAWVRHLISGGPLTVHDPATALKLWDLAQRITEPLDPRRPGDALPVHQALTEYHALLGHEDQAQHHHDQAQALTRKRRHGALV